MQLWEYELKPDAHREKTQQLEFQNDLSFSFNKS